MDRYVNSGYIRETVSITSNYNYAEYILGRTKKYITGATTSFAVISCLNRIMYADYPTSGYSGYSTAMESTYKSKIKSGYPMIFALTSWKGVHMETILLWLIGTLIIMVHFGLKVTIIGRRPKIEGD